MLQQPALFLCARCLTWEHHKTSSIENLWAVLQERAKELQTVIGVKQLTRQLQEAWTKISPDVLYTGVRHTGRRWIFHHT